MLKDIMTESNAPSTVPISIEPAPTLYDATTVGLATFLGTPLAGSAVMAVNYKRLGMSSAALRTVIVGVVATVLLLVAGFFLPSGPGTNAIGSGALLATVAAARSLQGPMLESHRQAGGNVGSRWFGAGVGVVGLLIVGGAILVFVLANPAVAGTRLAVGEKDEIYYSGKASESDARALARALQEAGFFKDRGATVQLSKGDDGTSVSFTVHDGIWDDPKMVAAFETVARGIAPSIGGLPVTLRLLNESNEVKKTLSIR